MLMGYSVFKASIAVTLVQPQLRWFTLSPKNVHTVRMLCFCGLVARFFSLAMPYASSGFFPPKAGILRYLRFTVIRWYYIYTLPHP